MQKQHVACAKQNPLHFEEDQFNIGKNTHFYIGVCTENARQQDHTQAATEWNSLQT